MLQRGFYSFRPQTDQHQPFDPGTSYTAVIPKEVADVHPDTPRNTRDRSQEYHTRVANMSFYKINLRSHSGSVVSFLECICAIGLSHTTYDTACKYEFRSNLEI